MRITCYELEIDRGSLTNCSPAGTSSMPKSVETSSDETTPAALEPSSAYINHRLMP